MLDIFQKIGSPILIINYETCEALTWWEVVHIVNHHARLAALVYGKEGDSLSVISSESWFQFVFR
jgi:hypothetical protein